MAMIENAIAAIPVVPTEGIVTVALAAVTLKTIESDACCPAESVTVMVAV
jgi:hypothetical protein